MTYKKEKPVRVGSLAQITNKLVRHRLDAQWNTMVFVTEIKVGFAKVLMGETTYQIKVVDLTGIESEEDIFTPKQWEHSIKCQEMERFIAARDAIEALK